MWIDYRGLAALVIATCGSIGLFIIIPTAVLMGYRISEPGLRVLLVLGGVLIGAFATYMGTRNVPK